MTERTYSPSATRVNDEEQTHADEEISVLRVIGVVLRHLWLIFGVGMALASFSLIVGLTTSHVYTADAAFMPEGASTTSTASALAAQFGIGSFGVQGGQSAQFYIDLLNTREVLRNVVRARYAVRTDSGMFTGDLLALLKVRGKTPLLREDAGKNTLRRMIAASVNTKTGIIRLTATSAYPDLSSEIVANLLQEINRFNLERRQSRASAERKFTEEQLKDAEAALTAAEDRLEEFLRSNRTIEAPGLVLQRDRLNRTVLARQQIYTALAQAAEQAKIDEVRDTPAITVVEPPVPPLVPDSRGTIPKTIKSFVFGLLLGTVAAFLLEFLKYSSARDSDGREQLKTLAREALNNPLRRRSSATSQ